MISYSKYTSGLRDFFHDYEHLKQLEDLANDYTKSSDDIALFRKRYLFEKSLFDENCNGKYIQFPVINKDGTNEIQQKKVEEGKYEYLKPYIDIYKYPTYVRAVLALRKDLDITIPDGSLCCTADEYYELKIDKEYLEHKIEEYRQALAKVKSKINDYEWVHNIQT